MRARRTLAVAASIGTVLLAGPSIAAAAPAAGNPTYAISLTSPNGAARLTGSIEWVSSQRYYFSGTVSDLTCNSNDVFARVFSNEGYGYVHQDKFQRNSNGCGTSVNFTSSYDSSPYTMVHVTFEVCDDSTIDSCKSLTKDNVR